MAHEANLQCTNDGMANLLHNILLLNSEMNSDRSGTIFKVT